MMSHSLSVPTTTRRISRPGPPAFLLCLLVIAATLTGSRPLEAANDKADPDLLKALQQFSVVLSRVESSYATEVDSAELVESAVRGMLRTLDPHSSFFAASDYSKLQEEQKGQYFGLGILIRPAAPGSGRVVVVEPPSPGTPAYKVGLQPGDVIFRVDGEPIDEWVYPDEVIPRIKGPKGTTVKISVQRPGEASPLELEVERDAIPIYTIKHVFHLRPGVGYIRIERFGSTTGKELGEALDELGEKELEGLVLDLRNNPGGSLREAIAVSDRFLKRDQVIVKTRNRDGATQPYLAPEGRQHLYPMVVLINRYSASGSEIVAGALQDHDRALLLGATTFGKALVQTVFPLPGERGLALTTGRYQTPSGRLIQRPFQPGFYDYLYANQDAAPALDQAFLTDSGRPVYGGGGIRPDVEEAIDRYTPFAANVNRKNLFYKYAGMLIHGEVEGETRFQHSLEKIRELSREELDRLKQEVAVSEDGETLGKFREFVEGEGLKSSDEDFDESRRQLANRLQQEVFLVLFGETEGVRVQLRIDNQVQKALELLPRARALIQR